MALFSDRLQLSRAAIIVDDAPQWFRRVYVDQVISEFLAETYIHHSATSDRPVGAKWLIQRIAQLVQTVPDSNYLILSNTQSCLNQMLFRITWFNFYDVIEIIAAVTLASDEVYRWKQPDSFIEFRKQTNVVLSTSAIGWHLSEAGALERILTEERALAEAQLNVLEMNAPSRVHIAKARLMLSERPCDAANIIKEAVSAIESAGKAAYPSASTLGDVLGCIRRAEKAPPMLIVVLEKLYGFANSEPGVRHGSNADERVTRSEAEFIYTMALATISYLEALGTI